MDFFFSSSLMFYINQQQQNHSYNASSSSCYHLIKWWKAKNHPPLTQYILEVNKQLKSLTIQWKSRQKLTEHEDESQEIHLEMREGSEVWKK